MFLTWEDERDDLVAAALVASLAPADEVHARLCLAFGNGHGVVETLAEQAVGLLGQGTDDEDGAYIAAQQEQPAALAGIAGILHLLCLVLGEGV